MCVVVNISKFRLDRVGYSPLGDKLEAKAKELWLAAGQPPGMDIEFWNDAEREIIGYTKEEFAKLYDLYSMYQDFFFDAPILLCWTDEQIEALACWGYQSWQLWTLPSYPPLNPDPFPFASFDFSKRRYKTVAELFARMHHAFEYSTVTSWPY